MNGFMRFCIGLAALLVAGSIVYQARTYRVYNRYQAVKYGEVMLILDRNTGRFLYGPKNFEPRHSIFVEKYGKRYMN